MNVTYANHCPHFNTTILTQVAIRTLNTLEFKSCVLDGKKCQIYIPYVIVV